LTGFEKFEVYLQMCLHL